MKSTFLILTALTLPFFFTSCGGDETAGTDDGYSLKVCPVSGEELGSMGDPHVVTHDGTKVKLCCDSCVEDFEKEPAKYVAMVKAGKVPETTE